MLRLILPWAVLVVFVAPPLTAQTPYRGVLEWIEFLEYPLTCGTGTGTNSTVEVKPPAATAVATHTVTCAGSSITLNLVAEFPLVTSPAAFDTPIRRQITFEESLRTKFKVTVTYNHPGARMTTVGWAFPAYDIPPNPYSASSNGTCEVPQLVGGAGSGTWSVTQSVDCLRNKVHTYGAVVVNGESFNYFQPWADVRASIAWGGTGPNPTDEFGGRIIAKAFYRMEPADSAKVTVVTPPAGLRQDPGQLMSNIIADVNYELASQENGTLKILVADQDGKPLHEPAPMAVKRGAGQSRVNLGPIQVERNSTEIRVTAELVGNAPQKALSQSAPIRYPVSVDLKAMQVEAIQVVQSATNGIPLAADNPTFLRFYGTAQELRNPVFSGAKWLVRAYRDDEELPGSPLLAEDDDCSLGEALNRDDEHYLRAIMPPEWTTAGATRITAEINPPDESAFTESNRTDNTLDLVLKFGERPRFDLRYRSICIQPGDQAPECPPARGFDSEIMHLVSLLPLQGGRFSYEALPLPPKVWRYPLKRPRIGIVCCLSCVPSTNYNPALALSTSNSWGGCRPAAGGLCQTAVFSRGSPIRSRTEEAAMQFWQRRGGWKRNPR
ncbi:MAG: hypothetical protein IPP47_21260 [Bryobacterales bacterium]|nr:hypothetical protein [Bryobacterales bacterium]